MQMRVTHSTSPTIQEEDTSCIAQQHPSDDSGLHIECGQHQLHLHKVSKHTKWLITDGFKAWSILRSGGIDQHLPVARTQQEPQNLKTADPTMTEDGSPRCPFAALQPTAPNPHVLPSSRDGLTSQNDVLSNGSTRDPIAAENHPTKPSSQPPTQACPIRFLEQHSPEEVAEYFTKHRHEIPRSHEICVKRYQKNEDQIRLLDHKYGSLVNMIQGLGQKHQPMLHTRVDGQEAMSQDRASQEKVEAWAQEVDDDGHKAVRIKDEPVEDNERVDNRKGHFDRPLKEIRVGESPSRPWGISVPHGTHIPPSAASHHAKPDIGTSHRPEPPTPPTASPVQADANLPFQKSGPADRQPSMLFTGPVFIGYAPAQIVDILQRTGLGQGS